MSPYDTHFWNAFPCVKHTLKQFVSSNVSECYDIFFCFVLASKSYQIKVKNVMIGWIRKNRNQAVNWNFFESYQIEYAKKLKLGENEAFSMFIIIYQHVSSSSSFIWSAHYFLFLRSRWFVCKLVASWSSFLWVPLHVFLWNLIFSFVLVLIYVYVCVSDLWFIFVDSLTMCSYPD